MDAKELNIAIYRAIASKANELFQRVNISAGTYSAKELAERKRGKECLCWEMENGYEEITISVESFVCRFVASMVFAVLARFEKLVPSKERVKFTRCEESETVCRLSIQVSRDAATVAKFTDKADGMREALKYVFFDAARGVLVATNGKRLAVRPVSISNIKGELPENGLYILPKFLKVGSYEIACIKKNGELFTQATNAAGETSLCPSEWRYPDYRRVIPEGGTAIRVLDVKTFSAFVKQAAKDKECKLRIESEAGSGRISVAAVERWNEANVLSKIEVELLSLAPCTAVFGYDPSELIPALTGWTGELSLKEDSSATVIGSAIGQTVVVLCKTNDSFCPQISEEIEIRNEIKAEPEPKPTERRSSEKIIEQAKEFARLITLLRRNIQKRHSDRAIKQNLKKFRILLHDEYFRSVTVPAYAPKSCYTDGTLTEFYRRCELLAKFENPYEALALFPNSNNIREPDGIPGTFKVIRRERVLAWLSGRNAHTRKQNRGYSRQNTGQKYRANRRGRIPIGPPSRISPTFSPNQWDPLGKSVLLFCLIGGTVSLNQWDCFADLRGYGPMVGTIRPIGYYNSS